MNRPMSDELELEMLGTALDIIERQGTREQKIAALRCFIRGTHGKPNIDSDVEILRMKAGPV